RKGREVLPPPSNLHYSFGQLCKLKWTWNPAEGIHSGCDLKYCSEILINGIPQDNRVSVSLNEEVHFRVRSECKSDNTSEPSNWVKISTPPKGAAGTAAVGINCTWHDLEYMVCTWLPGQNANASTNYTLYYWYEGLGNHQQCQNYIYGENFGCNFSLSIPNSTNGLFLTGMYFNHIIHVKINFVQKIGFFSISVKPGPPRIVTVSMIRDEIHIEWQKPGTFPPNCLAYQVEFKDSKSDFVQLYDIKQSNKTWLKILIYPQIPDPRKIIKRMFGEQIEDSQVSICLLAVK
uniref:Interleukin 13 receptor subunit alpha 1 n=1 Tax=Chelydra serpentina TaxID=8475 RepID=A0A8C3SHZ6_CHESE